MTKAKIRDFQNIFSIVAPLIIFVIVTATIASIQKNYEKSIKEYLSLQATIASRELSLALRLHIKNKVDVLKTIAGPHGHIFPGEPEHFYDIAKSIYENSQNFFAINWIAPDGHIRWVYPEEPNKLAKNRNVLQRSDISHYIREARDTREPRLSDLVRLYQGLDGFTMYIPIYHGETFRGWLNGVISYKDFLNDFFAAHKFKNYYAEISWEGYDEAFYSYGEKEPYNDPDFTKTFTSELLNQKLKITYYLAHRGFMQTQKNSMYIVFCASYVFAIILAISWYFIFKNYFEISAKNQKLKLDNTLINILCHDIAAPLTVVTESAVRLKGQITPIPNELERIIRSSEKQQELLQRIKLFHAANLGKLRMELVGNRPLEMIQEALSIYDDQILAKKIKINIDVASNLPHILCDRMTAVHNVFSNVISNAIKFSPQGSQLKITSEQTDKTVAILITDNGIGISKKQLPKLMDEDSISSRTGTSGEKGTGLGMIQIYSFMQSYGAKVEIISQSIEEFPEKHGTTVKLIFNKV